MAKKAKSARLRVKVRGKRTPSSRRLPLYAAAFAVLATVAVIIGFASPLHFSATLAVAPSSPKIGDNLVFTGCGYKPNAGLNITVQTAVATTSFGSSTDSKGCFDSSKYEVFTAQVAGEYTVKAFQDAGTGDSGKQPKASTTLAVN